MVLLGGVRVFCIACSPCVVSTVDSQGPAAVSGVLAIAVLIDKLIGIWALFSLSFDVVSRDGNEVSSNTMSLYLIVLQEVGSQRRFPSPS